MFDSPLFADAKKAHPQSGVLTTAEPTRRPFRGPCTNRLHPQDRVDLRPPRIHCPRQFSTSGKSESAHQLWKSFNRVQFPVIPDQPAPTTSSQSAVVAAEKNAAPIDPDPAIADTEAAPSNTSRTTLVLRHRRAARAR